MRHALDQEHNFKMVRPRGLEPPLVAQLAPQASASTTSAMAAIAHAVESASAPTGRRSSNKSAPEWQARRRAEWALLNVAAIMAYAT